MEFRRLVPDPGPVEVRELLGSLDLAGRAPAQRPYTIANFVASADGRVTLGGLSGKLSDAGDREMFHTLREQADAVLVGTGTLRAERYGRLVPNPDARSRRAQRGLRPEPLACVLTRSGDVPTDIPLFAEAEAEIVVFSPVEIDTRSCQAKVEVVQLDRAQLTFVAALKHLREHRGIAGLLCEGGPTVFGALLQERVVDELFLTLAPKLTGGGGGPTISSGPELVEARSVRLEWLLEHDDSLYLRYALG
jgi:riboflavin-specific deaminase-like protein